MNKLAHAAMVATVAVFAFAARAQVTFATPTRYVRAESDFGPLTLGYEGTGAWNATAVPPNAPATSTTFARQMSNVYADGIVFYGETQARGNSNLFRSSSSFSVAFETLNYGYAQIERNGYSHNALLRIERAGRPLLDFQLETFASPYYLYLPPDTYTVTLFQQSVGNMLPNESDSVARFRLAVPAPGVVAFLGVVSLAKAFRRRRS